MDSLFKKYQVLDVKTVEEFLSRYYRADRYTARGKEYADALLKNYTEDFEENGYTYIDKHGSNTGQTVSFYKEV